MRRRLLPSEPPTSRRTGNLNRYGGRDVFVVDFYNEVAKFVRGEDNDIKSGTIEMIQAEIVKRLIAENPHLAAEDKLPELTKAVATIYDRTVVTLTNEDVPF